MNKYYTNSTAIQYAHLLCHSEQSEESCAVKHQYNINLSQITILKQIQPSSTNNNNVKRIFKKEEGSNRTGRDFVKSLWFDSTGCYKKK